MKPILAVGTIVRFVRYCRPASLHYVDVNPGDIGTITKHYGFNDHDEIAPIGTVHGYEIFLHSLDDSLFFLDLEIEPFD